MNSIFFGRHDIFEIRYDLSIACDWEDMVFGPLGVQVGRHPETGKPMRLVIHGLKWTETVPEEFIDWLSAEVEDWKECLEEMEEVIKELHEHQIR